MYVLRYTTDTDLLFCHLHLEDDDLEMYDLTIVAALLLICPMNYFLFDGLFIPSALIYLLYSLLKLVLFFLHF